MLDLILSIIKDKRTNKHFVKLKQILILLMFLFNAYVIKQS